MPCIRGEHDGRAAFVPAAIIDAARYKNHKEAENSVLRGVRPYKALIDTGATSTMISEKVKSELNLQPVTKILFQSLDGLSYKLGCLFHVAFYEDLGIKEMANETTEIRKLRVRSQVVTGGILGGSPSFDVLIGMDIISTWDMRFTPDGKFQFSF